MCVCLPQYVRAFLASLTLIASNNFALCLLSRARVDNGWPFGAAGAEDSVCVCVCIVGSSCMLCVDVRTCLACNAYAQSRERGEISSRVNNVDNAHAVDNTYGGTKSYIRKSSQSPELSN